jgi:hypothetical protein
VSPCASPIEQAQAQALGRREVTRGLAGTGPGGPVAWLRAIDRACVASTRMVVQRLKRAGDRAEDREMRRRGDEATGRRGDGETGRRSSAWCNVLDVVVAVITAAGTSAARAVEYTLYISIPAQSTKCGVTNRHGYTAGSTDSLYLSIPAQSTKRGVTPRLGYTPHT